MIVLKHLFKQFKYSIQRFKLIQWALLLVFGLGMNKVFSKGIIITKNTTFKDRNIVGLLAWLFLTLIK
ncbi:hypothetical protein XO09_03910 [Thermosipho sp. 1223]|nr:hypothetical protein [Thermosipho sp. 1244]OOC47020.1 hypothetical protein XO09_03910 [Thermosipho sp. 1223]